MMFSFELSSETPCPTHVFLAIVRISYLRAVQAAGASFKSVIQPSAHTILDEIAAFSPDDWKEPFSMPATAEYTLMARIYKTAATLYGVLTLYFPQSRSEAYIRKRRALRDDLLQLIREALQILKSKMALAWPVSILAVALADGGDPKDKALIEDILCGNTSTNTLYMPMFRMRILKRFWDSGKTSWDDCYFEPFPPLA